MRTVAKCAVWCLVAILTLTTATTRAAPTEQAGPDRYLSDLSPSVGGPIMPRLDLNANGGPLSLRTAGSPQTYVKGIGMKVAGSQPWLYADRPAGCTGFAATIGHDASALNTDGELAGFELYEYDSADFQRQVNFGDMGRLAVQQVVSRTLRSDTSYISISIRGNGLANWANARFTGCPAPTPTPTATATRTPTPVPPTATPMPTNTPVPPTSTTVPPTATPVPPPGTVALSPGEQVTVTCAASLVESGPQTARVLVCPQAPPTATSTSQPTATPGPAGFIHGIFDDANMHNPTTFAAMIDDVKARGFTAIMLTNGSLDLNDALLAVSDQKGIRVYLGAPDKTACADNVCWWGDLAGARAVAQPIVARLGAHPSLAGYYLRDEPDTDYAQMLGWLAQAFREADPGRDAFIVNNAIDARITTFSPPHMRPLVVDPYPFVIGQAACDLTTPPGPFAGFAYEPFIDELLSRSGKPAATSWFAIGQAFGGHSWRLPSAEELRAQHRIVRAKGAAGLFWFLWTSQPAQGLVGLKDRPELMAEVTAIAQGTSGGPACDGSATPTPVSTSTPTSTATSQPIATPTPTPGPTPSGSGVPAVPLNYAETVDQFWARHPANSSSAGYVASLGSPSPVIDVPSGANLQTVLDQQCPAAGCTLLLSDGAYGHVKMIGRSNVHFRGKTRSGARLRSVTMSTCAGAIDAGAGGTGSYTVLNVGLNNGEQWARDCFTNRHGNVSFKNLTFDGQQTAMVWNDLDHRVNGAAIWIRTMHSVWLEDVDVTGYRDGGSVHDGAIGGNFRVDNIVLRRVKFDTFTDRGPSTYAFFDGCHGCAILDSETGFSRAGAFTFFVNDDATEDLLPLDGQWAANELRLANYIVMRGNQIHGEQQSHAFAVQGRNALIEANRTFSWTTTFAQFQTRRPFNHPPGTYTYQHFGHRVRNNQIHSSFVYTQFGMPDNCSGDAPSLPPDQCLQAGDIAVTDNVMQDRGRLIETLQWTFGNVHPHQATVPWPSNYPKHAPVVVERNT